MWRTVRGVLLALALGFCASMPVSQAMPQAQETTMPEVSLQDMDYMAITVWAEARGEGKLGMSLVAHVILNRMRNPNRGFYGGPTAQGVVRKPKQFSCWNPGDPNLGKCNLDYLYGLDPNSGEGRAWNTARMVSFDALAGEPDPTKGATHYHTTAIRPYWAASLRKVTTIGNHIFYVAAK